MSDLMQQFNEGRARVVALDTEILDLEREAGLLEQQARDKRSARLAKKQEREGITKLLDGLQVQIKVQSHEQAAADARAQADKANTEAQSLLAHLEAKSRQVEEELAKLKAANAEPAK